ncbi:MAG: NAD(+)/NADH kinase [Clostridiaceae bacterium]
MKNIGININSSKKIKNDIINDIVKDIFDVFDSVKLKIYYDNIGIDDEVTKDLDFIIILGGDGTILRTSSIIAKYDVPILGVNMGTLGFLSSIEYKNFKETLLKIKSDNYHEENRMMLKCRVNNENIENIALNDIVISKGIMPNIECFEIYIDDVLYAYFKGDGVIISTPTGSTAYSMSAGGPIVYPTLKLIEITPICSHQMGVRPILIEAKRKIKVIIKNKRENIYLTIDGQKVTEVKEDIMIEITSSDYQCKLIKLEDYDYFSILRKKIILC